MERHIDYRTDPIDRTYNCIDNRTDHSPESAAEKTVAAAAALSTQSGLILPDGYTSVSDAAETADAWTPPPAASAMQVLANLFAGITLLFARPFTLGDELTVCSGALGGPIIGRVTGVTLTYVTVVTSAGPVLIPNSSVLAAAIGPAKEWMAG